MKKIKEIQNHKMEYNKELILVVDIVLVVVTINSFRIKEYWWFVALLLILIIVNLKLIEGDS